LRSSRYNAAVSAGEFHRFGGEYEREWKNAPDVSERVALALGLEPLEDARHLLPPITLPPPAPPLPEGPHPGTEFVVDFVGMLPLTREDVQTVLGPEKRRGLGFVRLWGQPKKHPARWVPLDAAAPDTVFTGFSLSWELTGLLSEGPEAVAELAGYVVAVSERAKALLRCAEPRETPQEAATRAARLIVLKTRFARAVEMRLMPQGRGFPSRSVWRAAYALGLEWGDLDLFHWNDPATGRRLFSMNTVGYPGYFLPERAAEGEETPGVALAFELPLSPAPLDVYDRMGVALAYLRQKLGGRPATADGAELDADRLYEDRDVLADAIQEMACAGIAPGSPDARRVF
jgi:cell division protein ZipA